MEPESRGTHGQFGDTDTGSFLKQVAEAEELNSDQDLNAEFRANNEEDEYGKRARIDLELKRIELKNERLRRRIDADIKKMEQDSEVRHRLTEFLVFKVVIYWVVFVAVLIILNGLGWFRYSDTLLISIMASGPIGIGGLAVIIMNHYFKSK